MWTRYSSGYLKGTVISLDLIDQENVFKRFILRNANINDQNLGSRNMLCHSDY